LELFFASAVTISGVLFSSQNILFGQMLESPQTRGLRFAQNFRTIAGELVIYLRKIYDNEGLASFGMRQGRLDCNHPEIVVPEPDLRTAIVESNMLN